ncbi:hypothetical protein I307_05924 [Cryptococcus deuterogattii 99/473]|uniref:Uncharacterized protein n=1 Tax=Cryptococcus deuterogattii Ram5 TaxID=1296110 RepID=A0A0D0V172_9TREE|nr:hypothetical protein I309_02416 [Cryptococcus deuterogattii LA55]KIR40234.1 hypothetical protein I313_03556 [Cryptococcus deuterogattii Ram5]KIR71948.1 hypothetical protein I310_03998 [Cryptococcus deuterogattii CA1014]KIR93510.1 hypothetical protein I304_02182 [Cryptococcus deuterogattii CBS 10090]KIR99777.1 hypothetical protein L804_02411 [Cryptococcus deuterogattii 2001/935-1]KIY54738.1 hypothetical protein I307_05924 [Cryptococcus deuterogattii 99/473]
MPQLAVVEKGRIDVPPGTPHRRSVSPVTRTRSNALSDKTIPVVSPLPSKTSTRIPSTSVKGLHLDPCEAPYIITHLTIELKPEERDCPWLLFSRAIILMEKQFSLKLLMKGTSSPHLAALRN